jgi:hypothetical protein
MTEYMIVSSGSGENPTSTLVAAMDAAGRDGWKYVDKLETYHYAYFGSKTGYVVLMSREVPVPE